MEKKLNRAQSAGARGQSLSPDAPQRKGDRTVTRISNGQKVGKNDGKMSETNGTSSLPKIDNGSSLVAQKLNDRSKSGPSSANSSFPAPTRENSERFTRTNTKGRDLREKGTIDAINMSPFMAPPSGERPKKLNARDRRTLEKLSQSEGHTPPKLGTSNSLPEGYIPMPKGAKTTGPNPRVKMHARSNSVPTDPEKYTGTIMDTEEMQASLEPVDKKIAKMKGHKVDPGQYGTVTQDGIVTAAFTPLPVKNHTKLKQQLKQHQDDDARQKEELAKSRDELDQFSQAVNAQSAQNERDQLEHEAKVTKREIQEKNLKKAESFVESHIKNNITKLLVNNHPTISENINSEAVKKKHEESCQATYNLINEIVTQAIIEQEKNPDFVDRVETQEQNSKRIRGSRGTVQTIDKQCKEVFDKLKNDPAFMQQVENVLAGRDPDYKEEQVQEEQKPKLTRQMSQEEKNEKEAQSMATDFAKATGRETDTPLTEETQQDAQDQLNIETGVTKPPLTPQEKAKAAQKAQFQSQKDKTFALFDAPSPGQSSSDSRVDAADNKGSDNQDLPKGVNPEEMLDAISGLAGSVSTAENVNPEDNIGTQSGVGTNQQSQQKGQGLS